MAVVLAAAGLAVAGPGATPLAGASPAASRAPDTYSGSPTFRELADSAPGAPAQAFMDGVAAISSNDVWAVGTTGGSAAAPAAEHWNGTTWSVVSVPAPTNTVKSFLQSVAAVSTNDVWAVGTDYPVSSDPAAQAPLIEHWNGSAWSVVPSPSLGPDYTQLNGVAAVSANNVWAVGNSSKNGSRIVTEVVHWNGTSWSIVPSPNVKGTIFNQLNQPSVVSANNIWAVGYSTSPQSVYSTLAEHWNGTSWSIVTTPTLSSSNYDLQGAAPSSLSASDVWAVGSILNKTGQIFHTLAEHWNGTAWKRVPIPSEPGSRESVLFNADALASNNVWATGWCVKPGTPSDEEPLMEHWNGTAWSLASTPTVAAAYVDLFTLAGISADDIWAVGSETFNTGVSYPLFEHWNGTAWTIVSGG